MYALDPNAAKQAENTGSRIAELGKYKGQFTRAQHIVSKNTGTLGIDFDFVSDTNQRARFSIYTQKSDGTAIYGFKQLMAIMTCLGLRNLAEPKYVKAKIYDFDLKREVETEVEQFPELLGKPIGLLFTMEEYDAGKWRPNLAGVFRAADELVASEILDRKTQPQQLAKMVLALKNKPYRGGSGGGSIDDGNRAMAEAGAGQDPDIPF